MISRDEAARIAALARLDLTGEELDRAARELTSILALVEEVAAVDISGVELDTAMAAAAALRDDVPVPSLAADETFANAPDADREAGLFRVPRVLGS